MIIKVCGMKYSANMQEVINLGVDWVGMIFYSKSSRYILSEDNSRQEVNSVCGAKRVGVFVNEKTDKILRIAAQYGLDIVQLHGAESPDTCTAIRENGLMVIKAFPTASTEDIEKHLPYSGTCDYYLFDTKCDAHGGSGICFDWSLLDHYKGDTPFLLSGGIHPDSATSILNIRHPKMAGVDLNSRFESAPGVKSIDLLTPFIQQLRKI